MSQFLVALIGDESVMEDVDPKQMEEIVAEMEAYNEQLEKAGVMGEGGGGLAPTSFARTLRYGEDGKAVVTDGPFAESKEHVAGFWIFECNDLDEAVKWAEKAPVKGGAIEVREIIESVDENVELFKEQAKKS
jgi:hypothetical protein